MTAAADRLYIGTENGPALCPGDQQRLRNTPAAKEKRYQAIVRKQAKAWKISPEEYQQFADEVHKEKTAYHQAREAAKAHALQSLGVTAADIQRWENQGLDYSSPKLSKYEFDSAGQSLASQYPDLGWGGGYGDGRDEGGHDAKLWELLKEGKVDPPSRHSEEFHADVDEYLQFLASRSPGGVDDAPDAEDTSFDFGALADDDAVRFALDAYRMARQRLSQDGPQEGDRKPAADGGELTFHQGRWHRAKFDDHSENQRPELQSIDQRSIILDAKTIIERFGRHISAEKRSPEYAASRTSVYDEQEEFVRDVLNAGKGTIHPARAAKAPAVTIDGHTYINAELAHRGTVIHEMMHLYASDMAYSIGGDHFDEGFAEWFTRKALESQKVQRPQTYRRQFEAIDALARRSSDDALAKAYFGGDFDELIKAVGADTLKEVIGFIRVARFDDAIAILEKQT